MLMVSGVFSELAPHRFDIDGQIVHRGRDVLMAEEGLYGTQINTSLDQPGSEAGTQHMRIVAQPGALVAGGDDAVVSGAYTECCPGIPVNHVPDATCRPERLPVLGDEQGIAFAWASCTALPEPVSKQGCHGMRIRQSSRLMAGSLHEQAIVSEQVSDTELDDFAGGDASLVDQAHHHMIPVADERGKVRLSQQSSDLGVCEQPGQLSRRPLRGWQVMAEIFLEIAELMRPTIEGPYGGKIQIERRARYLMAPSSGPLI